MLQESFLSVWSYISTSFTPSLLFFLINVIVGTIAFSAFSFRSSSPDHGEPAEKKEYFFRTNSVLERLKSLNVYRREEATAVEAILPKPVALQSSALESHEQLEERESQTIKLEEETVKMAKKMKRFGEHNEVDSKADDFISRFKKQLKLQRQDSITRYEEMLNRGE